MDGSKWQKLLYYVFVGHQIHSTLIQVSPTYAQLTETLTDNFLKKLGIKITLWDEVSKFLGSEKPLWKTFEVFDKGQNGLFEAFLNNLKIEKTIRLKSAHQPKDDIRLCNGEQYLESFTAHQYLIHDIRYSIRESANKPEFLKHHGENVMTPGFTADYVTFAYFDGVPIIFQRNSAESSSPMSITLLHNEQANLENLQKRFHDEVKYKSYFQNWVSACEDKDGKLSLSYIQEPCFDLRYKKYEYELFSQQEKKLIEEEIPHFIKTQDLPQMKKRRGFLIEGDQGSGKSALVKAIVSSMPQDYTIIIVKNNLSVLNSFNEYPYMFPLLVVIEDIDLILPAIETCGTRMLMHFLDGLNSPDKVITVMTATNAQAIHKVIAERPGRIDKVIKLHNGDIETREMQLEHLFKGLELEANSLHNLSKKMKSCTVAQLKELVSRSVIYAQDGTTIVQKKISEEIIIKAAEELNLIAHEEPST